MMDAGPSVAAIVLAAGRSTRMGPGNKLLMDIGGKPMLHRTLDAVHGAGLQQVIVVTGFQSDQIEESIARYPVEIVHNPCFFHGMGTSLGAGIASLPDSAGAVIVFLADMPHITADVPNRLVHAHSASGNRVCIPVFSGRRGNPVLWPRRYFKDLGSVEGDAGGRHLIRELGRQVLEVPVYSNSILNDIDTVQDLGLQPIHLKASSPESI